MGSEEEEKILQIDAQIAEIKRQLEMLVSQRAGLIKKVKRAAPEDMTNATVPSKRKKVESDVLVNLDIGASVEIGFDKEETQIPLKKQSDTDNVKDDWKTIQKKRVPPIYVYNIEDWAILADTLRLICTEEFTARNLRDGIKIQPKNCEAYKSISSLLEAEKIEHHTYLLEKEPHLKVVIKNLPSSITPETVAEKLREKKFNIIKVSQLKDKMQTKTGSFLTVIKKDDTSKEIYSMTNLCYCKVRVEQYKNNGNLTQCVRCQRFGHTSNTCHVTPKCVKCARDHLTQECPKKSNQSPAKCFNCGGNHPANYRGCPYFLNIKEKSVKTKVIDKPKAKKIAENYFTPRMSFADKVKNTKLIPPTNDQNNVNVESKINNMMALLSKICSHLNLDASTL